MEVSQKQYKPVPKTGKDQSISAQIKSLFRNTLLASPDFPRFYADAVISSAPNSPEAKILAQRYEEFCRGMNMPNHPSVKLCSHIKVTGVRCGSPALRGEEFCYFHQRMMRGVNTPPSQRLHPVAMLENEESIQASLMEIVNALARNMIDLKRADLILKALHIAVKNARRVRFDSDRSSIVQQVPAYPAPPMPAVPKPAMVIAEPTITVAAIETNPASRQLDPAQRMPPASAKATEAPKDRQIAAHRGG